MCKERCELIESIKSRRIVAIKEGNKPIKMAMTMILGEADRLNKLAGESATDEELIKIIRGLIKSERITVEFSGMGTSEYLEALESVIPVAASREGIINYLNTVDFSALSNKFQAISIVKKHFGEGRVDGILVKDIINEHF